MKKIFSALVLIIALLIDTGIALAQATCTVNGEEVPCEELGGLLGAGLGLMAFMIILGIVGFIIWLLMIIHAASKPIPNKAMWIIIMVLLGPIGAIIYYFVVKRRFKEGPQTVQSQSSEQMQGPPQQQ